MKISGIYSQLGEELFDHTSLRSEIGCELADRIKDKSGFETRFITSKNSDIFRIAQSLMDAEKLADRLTCCDFIIVVSEYVVKLIPPPSAFLLSNIELDDTLVIDLNRGCSGFCEALVLAYALFTSKTASRGCVITAENYSKIIDRDNSSLSPIFSDAVTFTFLSSTVGYSFLSNSGSFHRFKEDLLYDTRTAQLKMNGAGLISFVKAKVIPKIKLLLEDAGNPPMLDYFFVHQGSSLVVDAINQSFPELPFAAEFTSAYVGNTNSSSIPMSINSLLLKKNVTGRFNCLLSGFGVGLSFCNVLLELEF